MNSAQQPGSPSGIVTFLFTDVEGSTAMWERAPRQMKLALARHDELVRDRIERQRGYVFSVAGDAFAAAFHTATEALRAARDIQAALVAESWPEPLVLRVRIGLHTGTADERDGDYFGATLNRTARLMSAGHGGQILVSAATFGLLDGEHFYDLGEHRLKDLSAPEHIYQAEYDGPVSEFPPLRTLDVVSTNLPIRTSALVGRESELTMLAAATSTSRIVTVIGPGGVGKTSLSVQLAADLVRETTGGVWFVELAPIRDGAAIPYQFANALDVSIESGHSITEAVIARLGESEAVLVVDNCEHVRRGVAEFLGELLARCRRIRVIASSREPLGIPGESVHTIQPLACDGPDAPAVTLLRNRLLDANPSVDLTGRSKVLIEICRSLDGLPLAIELAAARARSMTPEDIAGRLDTRLKLLKNRRGNLDRHATLRATIEWSYHLLDSDERVLFQRLSIFEGTFSLEAAERVCADDDLQGSEVLDALHALVDRSMVVADVRGTHAVYSMLLSIREFAAEELGDLHDAIAERHLQYYANWIRTVTADGYGADEVRAVGLLDNDWDNIRAAVAFALGGQRVDAVIRLLGSLAFDVLFRSRIEVTDWLHEAKSLIEASDEPTPLEILAVDVACASVEGDSERVARRGEEFLDRVRDRESDTTPFDIITVGFALSLARRNEPSLALYRIVERLAESSGDSELMAWALLSQAQTYAYLEDLPRARALSAEGRSLIPAESSLSLRVAVELVDGLRGDDPPEVTVDRMTTAVRQATSVRAELFRSVCVMADAAARGRMGELQTALVEAAEILQSQRSSGSVAVLSQQFRRLAVLLLRAEKYETAAMILGFLHHQIVPEINPVTARELAELVPRMRDHLGEGIAEIEARAAQIDLSDVIAETVEALRDAASNIS